jgi:hypothetical protein
LYATFKFLHVLGAIILVGNVTVTAVGKVFADRTHDARVVAFGQRLVTITDWSLTAGGIALLVLGGYGAALVGRVNQHRLTPSPRGRRARRVRVAGDQRAIARNTSSVRNAVVDPCACA